MKITNKKNLPRTIADALKVSQARYNKGDAWMSVTGLQKPPRMALLTKKHWKDLEEDVSDSFWKLFGSAVHTILEDGTAGSNAIIQEERLSVEVLGQKISGAMDIQEITDFSIEITDYKVTRAQSVMPNSFSLPSWTEQLNAYAHLVEENKGLPVSKLSICAILRDHSPSQAERQEDYPDAPVVIVDIPIWSKEERLSWLQSRVQAHLGAEVTYDTLDSLPFCTDEERWKRGDKWAVKATADSARAKRVFDSEDEAKEFKKDNPKWVVEHRPAEPLRCQSYCDVAKFCTQHMEEGS